MRSAVISSDGLAVAYVADQDQDEHLDLYGVPSDRNSPPVRLTTPATEDIRSDALSPDDSRVVYLCDEGGAGSLELFSAATDGTSPAVQLTTEAFSASGVEPSYLITSDSQRVVYTSGNASRNRIHSVPIDGSAAAIDLFPALLPTRDAHMPVLAPDGARVVFISNALFSSSYDLYSVPVDGSSAPLLLATKTTSMDVSPDSQTVVFRSSFRNSSRLELFSVPIDGSGAPVALSGAVPNNRSVQSFQLGSDSLRAVFVANLSLLDANEIYSTPLDGSTPPVKLNTAFASGRNIRAYQISPDATHVAYAADQETDEVFELYSAPIDGAQPPTKLNPPLASGGDVFTLSIGSDSAHVAYEANQDTQTVRSIYSAPMAGGAVTRLSPTGKDVSVTRYSDTRVSFCCSIQGGTGYVYAPIDGSGPAVLVNQRFTQSGILTSLARHAERMIFGNAEETAGVTELYSVVLDGTALLTKLNDPLALAPDNDVVQVSATPNGEWAVYRAIQDTDGSFEVYSARTDGSTPPVKLNGALVPGGSVLRYDVTPDSAHVVYTALQNSLTKIGIFSAPVDGSSPAIDLYPAQPANEDVVSNIVSYPLLTPDGAHVIFTAKESSSYKIFSAPPDGSSAPVLLAAFTSSSDPILGVSPDSSRVVYNILGAGYSAPIAAPGPSTLLSTRFPFFPGQVKISPDSRRVVFVVSGSSVDLWSAPIDGSLAPVSLIQIPFTGPEAFSILPGSDGVVFVGGGGTLFDLYRGTIDGSAPATKLSSLLGPGSSMAVSADGTRAVFLVDPGSGVKELYSIKVDGSEPRVRLNSALIADGDVQDFALSRNGQTVVYRADQEIDERPWLYSVPITGGSPVRLNAPNGFTEVQAPYSVSVNGNRVIYVADENTDGAFDINTVSFAPSLEHRTLNAPAVAGGQVTTNFVSIDGIVLFIGDLEIVGVPELFRSYVSHPPRFVPVPRRP